MDTDCDTSYTWDTNLEHQNPKSTKLRSAKIDLRHHLKPNCNDNYRH